MMKTDHNSFVFPDHAGSYHSTRDGRLHGDKISWINEDLIIFIFILVVVTNNHVSLLVFNCWLIPPVLNI